MTELYDIALAMPTSESGEVLEKTLVQAVRAEKESSLTITQFILVDDDSQDETIDIARRHAESVGWDLNLVTEPCSLPDARKRAIELVSTDWFLFLDDDVRLSSDYFETIAAWMDCERVGAVQGRKSSRNEPVVDWIRRRSRRGGTHATLLRTAAVETVRFPSDLYVLEDEYLRHNVETCGYRWILEPEARFVHASQERHPIGWQEGYLGGKYGLSTFHDVALNVPFAVVSGRNPLPHAKRAAGWIAGRYFSEPFPASTAQKQEVATNAGGK